MDVLITDKIAQRHTENTVVLEWHNRYDKSNNISINNYLDDNSIKVRDLYLEYIHKIGHDEIRNNSLVKKLHYKDNFSFWWLNLVSEKSPFKSKRIFEALRVISVFEIIKDLKHWLQQVPQMSILIQLDLLLINLVVNKDMQLLNLYLEKVLIQL